MGDKFCEWCKVGVVRHAKKGSRFCSVTCWGKARAHENRKGAVEPPPVAGAAWIPLADGRFALVDEDLAPELKRYSWAGGGSKGQYAFTSIGGGKNVYLHQMVLPNVRVDHKNGNTLDCRRENLRPATQRQNTLNMKSRAKKAPYKGIHAHPNPGGTLSWIAMIRSSGKRLYLGAFKTPEEAARAYDTTAREIHGEFACVNFPEEGERGALQ